GECLNTEGSYVCVCSDGYTTATGATGCQVYRSEVQMEKLHIIRAPPLGVKPGSQVMQEKEPCVLAHTPLGQAPGVWHSSTSVGR
ncbi:hypothetical protein CRUP_025898, partial [Coryphaenoides rupestris]